MQDDTDLMKRLKNGELTSVDVCRLIDWQLSLSAEKIDCALLSECYAYLYNDAERK